MINEAKASVKSKIASSGAANHKISHSTKINLIFLNIIGSNSKPHIILIFVQKKATFMFMYWNKSALVMR